MPEDDQVERCAQLCDQMVLQLEDIRKTARKAQYDRRSAREVDYAIRAVRRLGERIRALKSVSHETPDMHADGEKLARAIAVAKELRPIIAKTKGSAWKDDMLRRLDELAN